MAASATASISTPTGRTIGSLVLGYYDGKELRYAGRVGTGWSLAQAQALYARLEKLKTKRPPFRKGLPDGAEKGVTWVEPKLVCEVEYRDWTRDDVIRQSSFKGLREDKPPEEIGREGPAAAPAKAETRAPPSLAAFKLTHPERILWPEPGITKQGLAEYYADIADWILPHITGRVLSLMRSPAGVSEKGFFAKHEWAGLGGDDAERIDVGDKEPMLAINDLKGLMALVQASVTEIHPWGSTVEKLEYPDRLIFDLDPGEGVAWTDVIAAARDVRARLEKIGLECFVKTSGGKGLHVVLPVEPRLDWEAAKAFTQRVAEDMARERPDRYVATMTKRVRIGRIFVDYFRNGRGATAVAPYSTRALPRASVSVPLDWDELSESLRADHFTVDNVRHRLGVLKRDPWERIGKLKQRIPS
jgi:bifunctional non-homologous end joining protein LigD